MVWDDTDWSEPCQLFRFRVSGESWHVVIDLKGNGLDTIVKLHPGPPVEIGPNLGANDNSLEAPGSIDSRLRVELPPGLYYVEALLKNPSQATSDKDLKLTATATRLYRHDGIHQADRVVGYQFASDLPSVIRQSVSPAAAAWTTVGGWPSRWPYVTICAGNCSANSDGYVITIKSEDETKVDEDGCPNMKAACFRREWDPPDQNDHLHLNAASELVMEEPPRGLKPTASGVQEQVFRWTNVVSLHYKETDPFSDILYRYTGAVMIHELGHALGLLEVGGPFSGKAQSVDSREREFLRQIYTRYVN